jgi:hypothetical protein
MEEVSESIANIQKFKKLGKVVVAVAIAAVFCASLLATGVLAEDVKPSYDTTYFDADQKYFDWFERTAETLIADMTCGIIWKSPENEYP